MKRVFYFLIIVFFASCKKEGGNLVCTMKYNLTNEKSVNVKTYSSSDRYTQFGDYITSVTPSKFLIKFLDIRLCSTWENQMHNLAIIDNNKFAWTSTDRIADFSNNGTVNIDIDGKIANDVEMIYMVSIPMFYYQEFELPQQYYSFNIDSGVHNLIYLNCGGSNIDYPTANAGIGGVKEGLIVKCSNNALTAPIFDSTWIDNNGFQGNFPEIPQTTVFGNTDSTFIFSSTGTSKDDPLGTGGYIIRSNKFNSITLHAIAEGETKTMTGIMTFNSTNLIQIYAGKDNIPYTSDDIFVYAPKFWERLSVSLTSY
jgi:hypothetical protein